MLLAEEALGIVPVGPDVGAVVLRGFSRGSIVLRASEQPGELRFMSYSLDAKRAPLPIAVRSEGATLALAPRPGSEAERHEVQLFLPEGPTLKLELTDAVVSGSALPGALEVRGKGLTLELQGIAGGASLELEGGKALVAAVHGNLSVQGKEVDLRVQSPERSAVLRLTDGKASIEGSPRGLQVDSEGTAVSIENAEGVTVNGKKGRLDLVNVSGADLSLSGTPLTLNGVRGDVEIETDADLQFTECRAALHVEGSGGTLRGSGNVGLVEVRTSGAALVLERIDGPLRVQGNGLNVKVQDVTGETYLDLRDSEAEIAGNQGVLTIESVAGNILVRDSRAAVDVRATGGTVKLVGLTAPAKLTADVEAAEISWAALPSEGDSSLENEGGSLRVQLPTQGRCTIEATSRSGKIEGDLPALRVEQGAGSAVGVVGGGGGPTIRINSAWDVQLTGGPRP